MSLLHAQPPAPQPSVPDIAEQYDKGFVARWDDLIDWDVRARGEGSFFRDRLAEIAAHRVLDTATGTGFHAINFARAGFDVTAVDLAPEMVAQTLRNAATHGLSFPAHVCDWRFLEEHVHGPFDALTCLGSSFPHLIAADERAAVLQTFRRLLRPGGRLILDHRNFDAIQAGHYANTARLYYGGAGVAVSAVAEAGLCTFTYDFQDGEVFRLQVADIPSDTMRQELAAAGFGPITTYGDFKRSFDPLEVGFLIHVAEAS